jgi:hypothetical protein
MGAAKIDTATYDAELFRLQAEFIVLQEWVKATGARVVILFEGRDAAGKGGTIKRITQHLSRWTWSRSTAGRTTLAGGRDDGAPALDDPLREGAHAGVHLAAAACPQGLRAAIA